MIRRTGRKMEHRGKVYKELDHWYDEECQWKKKETKVKKQVKVSRYTPWRRMGERRYSSYSYLTSATRWG
jgi:hypothetical protein